MTSLPSFVAVTLGVIFSVGVPGALAQESPLPLPATGITFGLKDKIKTVQASSLDVLCEDGVYFEKNQEKPISVLIVQQVKSLTRLQSDEGDDYTLNATAYLDSDDYPKRKPGLCKTMAAKGIAPQFYHTTVLYQNESLATERYYELKTGHLVYTSNSELLTVITKGQDRFITMRRQYTQDADFPHGADHNTFAGLILYGDGEHVIKKLIVTGPDQDGVPDQPHVQLVIAGKLDLQGEVDSDDVTSYEVLVTLADATFHIPFDASGPLLNQIKDLPKGFAVSELAP